MTTESEWQTASKAHMAHTEREPGWMQFGLVAINQWGDKDLTLQHAVALQCQAAYEMGKAGEPPPVYTPPPSLQIGPIRRSRPVAEPEAPPTTLIRRRSR